MINTTENLKKLKVYTKDGNLTEEELIEILETAKCIWCAIADAWELASVKIGLQGERGYSIGTEKYDKISASELIATTRSHADYFRRKCTCEEEGLKEGESYIFRVDTDIGRWT